MKYEDKIIDTSTDYFLRLNEYIMWCGVPTVLGYEVHKKYLEIKELPY